MLSRIEHNSCSVLFVQSCDRASRSNSILLSIIFVESFALLSADDVPRLWSSAAEHQELWNWCSSCSSSRGCSSQNELPDGNNDTESAAWGLFSIGSITRNNKIRLHKLFIRSNPQTWYIYRLDIYIVWAILYSTWMEGQCIIVYTCFKNLRVSGWIGQGVFILGISFNLLSKSQSIIFTLHVTIEPIEGRSYSTYIHRLYIRIISH